MAEILNVAGTVEARESNSQVPTNIIPADETWSIRVTWNVSGLPASEGGIWYLKLYLEPIGSGPDFQLAETGPLDIPAKPGIGTSSYSHEIKIEAGALSAGVYKVLIVLTCKRKDADEATIVGFTEGPILQVYATRL